MSILPFALYTAGQVRELDSIAIKHGIAGLTLMERAGQAAYNVLKKNWPDAWRIVVVCGTGNNGGDGSVIARLAATSGSNVLVLYIGDIEKVQGDARTSLEKARESGVCYEAFSPDKLKNADLVVDAMLGTGLDRDVGDNYLQAICAINQSPVPVLAVDIPSGLNADTGQVMGDAICADITVSFIGLKQGLFTGNGSGYSGKVYFNDLDVPDEIYQSVPVSSRRIDTSILKPLLPPRKATLHKGNNGHVLIIGGEKGYAGAARMAAEAAGRSGAGLVSLATRECHATLITSVRPEIMAHGIEQCEKLNNLYKIATVIAIGPGLGQSRWSRAMLSSVLETTLPLVLDADALNLLAGEPMKKDNWILTPHPGEAARLLQCTTTEVQQNRFDAVSELQARYGGVCVLKGTGTLIASEQGPVALCNQGNAGMATGGMGDVLTGVIAGLLAQGLDLLSAAHAGVCVHAHAGDLAAKEGQRGMLAMDLMPGIRKLVNP